MNRRKVCVVITARPSYSRIKTALQAILEHPDLELQIVIAASALLDKYGEVIRVIEDDGFEIARKVYMILDGEKLVTMAKTTGIGIMELATTFDNLKPDIVVTIADRYETIATAISAAYMNIPLAHVQGGEVTGSIDEKVRHSITKLADLHFVSNENSAQRVLKMGENPQSVFVTGCPSIDLTTFLAQNGELSINPIEKYGGVGGLRQFNGDYLVVMQHPVTNHHKLAQEHVSITLKVVKELRIPALWFWPNVDAGSDGTSRGIRHFRETENPKNIRFFKNIPPEDFLKILYNTQCIVGNSSVAIRECAFMGVPAVNIGSRQKGRDRGRNVIDVDHIYQSIKEGIEQQMKNGRYQCDTVYGDGNAGKRIADFLARAQLKIEKRITY